MNNNNQHVCASVSMARIPFRFIAFWTLRGIRYSFNRNKRDTIKYYVHTERTNHGVLTVLTARRPDNSVSTIAVKRWGMQRD